MLNTKYYLAIKGTINNDKNQEKQMKNKNQDIYIYNQIH